MTTVTSAQTIFHYSIPVADIAESRAFYGETLGCSPVLGGRLKATRCDFSFFGHHLSLKQVSPDRAALQRDATANFEVMHFGVIMEWQDWHTLVERIQSRSVPFAEQIRIGAAGTPAESKAVKILDPSGNGLEFKAVRDLQAWFGQ